MTIARRSFLFLALGAAPACGSSGSGHDAGSPDGSVGLSDGAGVVDGGSSEDGALDSGIATGDSGTPAEAAAAPPPDASIPADAALLGDGGGAARFYTVVNQCTETVWAAALPATTFPGGYVEMAPGYAFKVGVANGWSGRIWGKVMCTTSGGKLTCASDPLPASLAELTLTDTPATGQDFYDVSLVDGFNLPIEIVAEGHVSDPSHPYSCGDPTCAVNLNATCPAPLQDIVGGQVLACANDECKVLGGNDASSPDCVYPNQYTRFFKTACPTAYSYPYDDPTSTFTCKGANDYAIVFCP